jgi:PLP dependent protein
MEVSIRENVAKILKDLPEGVRLEAAAKTRGPEEILEAAAAGVKIIGENYVQEAERVKRAVGDKVEWHCIGHLQKNKVKKAAEIFDVIETVDSIDLAKEIDKRCGQTGKVMPVLIEINSGLEAGKAGAKPEEAKQLIKEISRLENIRVEGLMTMGPAVGQPEEARRYFKETKKLFEGIKALEITGAEMKYLSMGMTDSYRVAIEEGANIVRIGSGIFGKR